FERAEQKMRAAPIRFPCRRISPETKRCFKIGEGRNREPIAGRGHQRTGLSLVGNICVRAKLSGTFSRKQSVNLFLAPKRNTPTVVRFEGFVAHERSHRKRQTRVVQVSLPLDLEPHSRCGCW